MRKLITDLEMPNLSGLELTRRVREVPHRKPRSPEAAWQTVAATGRPVTLLPWRREGWATIAESSGDATMPFYYENVMKVASSPGSLCVSSYQLHSN